MRYWIQGVISLHDLCLGAINLQNRMGLKLLKHRAKKYSICSVVYLKASDKVCIVTTYME